MKTLVISEEQMSFVIKEFLKQYVGNFDHVSFDDSGNGYIVHFHQSPESLAPMTGKEEETPTQDNGTDDSGSYLPPFSYPIPDFGGSATPDFGGGASGGAGATGDW